MKKREAEFTTKCRRWLRDNVGTGAYEIKHTRGLESFKMSELKRHQRDALLAVRDDRGLVYKIPDEGVSYRPFDLFVMRKCPAYVVICFPKCFVLIDIARIDMWQKPMLPLAFAENMAHLRRDLSVL